MSFLTDKQTLDELNLKGKFRNGSVYALFNKVKTAGGERLLNDMFSHPLTDAEAINERSKVFRYFQHTAQAFPFEVQQIEQMRDYLDSGNAQSKLMAYLTTLLWKSLSTLTRDERYRKAVQGLHATINTLNRCYNFVVNMPPSEGLFAQRVKQVKELLEDRRVAQLRNINIYKAVPAQSLSAYGHLLKSGLYKEMQDVLAFIAELDIYIAVTNVARDKGFHYAIALPAENDVLHAEKLYHPCIDNAVGNTICLSRSSNVLFLTGANMAGKSTLMKSIGIGMYLAHMGFPVAAEAMKFSVRDGLYSSINVADNIHLGYSHFYAEVVRVKQAAEAAASGKRFLLMFDELFKGTNVKDAYDGTLAVTEAFSEYDDCLFIVSTHIIEVGESLKRYGNIRFVFMPTIMEGAYPRYTYRLTEGITEDRQGMMIIRNEGILELLND